MMLIGIVLISIGIIFILVVSFAYEIVYSKDIIGWIDFIYDFLFFSGVAFMGMAYKKKHGSK